LLDFLSTMRAAGMATGAKKPSRLIRVTILLLVFPGQAAAHDFALGGDAYAKFLSGCAAVLTELPVMIAMIATGILVSLWDREGLPKVWLAFVAGVAGGMLVATAALIEPLTVAYGSAIALGLLAAAAVRPDVKLMRLVLFFAGFLPVAALLSDHDFGTVPPPAYAGILFMSNVVLSASAGLVSITLKNIPFSWVSIAFRALASWLVAIALISFAVLLRAGS
jgi:hypothetical protein